MYYRVPEKNKWYHLDPQKVEQEQEQEQESDTDSTSEDLDESMDSGTSEEWGSWWGGFHTLVKIVFVYSLPYLEYA